VRLRALCAQTARTAEPWRSNPLFSFEKSPPPTGSPFAIA
jgi:hypothetical protein